MADVPLWITVMLWASRLVLVLLVGLSIWSVATMIKCYRLLQAASGGKEDKDAFDKVRETVNAGRAAEVVSDSVSTLYHSVVRESASVTSHDPTQIDRSVKSLLLLKRTQLEGNLTILATLGSNAPFIGLFGTVLGIVQALAPSAIKPAIALPSWQEFPKRLSQRRSDCLLRFPPSWRTTIFHADSRVLIVNCEALRDLYVARLKRA